MHQLKSRNDPKRASELEYFSTRVRCGSHTDPHLFSDSKNKSGDKRGLRGLQSRCVAAREDEKATEAGSLHGAQFAPRWCVGGCAGGDKHDPGGCYACGSVGRISRAADPGAWKEGQWQQEPQQQQQQQQQQKRERPEEWATGTALIL